jgi:nicotinate-nucleotide adenylyltransferase
MKFYRRSARLPARLGVFPGTFNPVTVAHLALANAALDWVDEVVFVLPRELPHKDVSGASFSKRLEILDAAAGENPAFSIADSDGGLFLEISAECRDAYGPGVRQSFLCGRDAADRIVAWDYGRPGVLKEMLDRFDFLVAARQGEYTPPELANSSFRRLELTGEFDHVSASEVRRRIAGGLRWESLVPRAARAKVLETYAPIARQSAE